MAIKITPGLAKYLLVTGCAQDAFALGFINFYSGAAPATAGAAWNIQTTILLDYETYLSEGLASIALVNESAIPF